MCAIYNLSPLRSDIWYVRKPRPDSISRAVHSGVLYPKGVLTARAQ